MSAVTFVGGDLYGICVGDPNVQRFALGAPPPASPSLPPTTASPASSQLHVGASSTVAFTLTSSGALEAFDAARGVFFGKPVSGDLLRVDTSGSVTTVVPYNATLTGFPALSTPTATLGAVRVSRGDPCNVYIGMNEAAPEGHASKLSLGTAGGLVLANVCGNASASAFVDLSIFRGEEPTAVSDIVLWNGNLITSLLFAQRIIVMNLDGSRPSSSPLVHDSLIANNCNPDGLETTTDGKYVLISCFNLGDDTSKPPVSALMRWDPATDEVTPVIFNAAGGDGGGGGDGGDDGGSEGGGGGDDSDGASDGGSDSGDDGGSDGGNDGDDGSTMRPPSTIPPPSPARNTSPPPRAPVDLSAGGDGSNELGGQSDAIVSPADPRLLPLWLGLPFLFCFCCCCCCLCIGAGAKRRRKRLTKRLGGWPALRQVPAYIGAPRAATDGTLPPLLTPQPSDTSATAEPSKI